jgi:hypothetical protein
VSWLEDETVLTICRTCLADSMARHPPVALRPDAKARESDDDKK